MKIKFRESTNTFGVELIVNGVFLTRRPYYQEIAEYAKMKYNLSDSELMEIYYDYKEDYDSRF